MNHKQINQQTVPIMRVQVAGCCFLLLRYLDDAV